MKDRTDMAPPLEVQRELDRHIKTILALGRPKEHHIPALAAAIERVWRHGAEYGKSLLADLLADDVADEVDVGEPPR